MAWYKSGTISVNNGDNFITGTGTSFASNSRVGDAVRAPDGEWYEVINIASDTVISIYPSYVGSSVFESADYMIAPIQGYNKETADRLRAISDSFLSVRSVAGKTGDVVLNQSDVGLDNVNNTADLDKPISNAVSIELGKRTPTVSNIDTTVDRLVKVGDFGENGGVPIVSISTDDANNLTVNGLYSFSNGGFNLPESKVLIKHLTMGNFSKQNAQSMETNKMYVRTRVSGVWSSWSTSLDQQFTSDLASTTLSNLGASLVGYRPDGASQGMTLFSKLSQSVHINDFGVVPNSTTDQSTLIQAAIDYSSENKRSIKFGPGFYYAKNLQAKVDMDIVSEKGPANTIIFLVANSTTGLIVSPTNRVDDISIEGFTFHGNTAQNVSFPITTPLVRIVGCRKSIINNVFTDSPGSALETDFDVSQAERRRSFLDYIVHNLIENSQGSGWLHRGGSDLYCAQMEVIDVGLAQTNTYYGIRLFSGSGNGCFFNVHTWNRSSKTIVPDNMIRIESNGNTFTGCHFEGGRLPVYIGGAGNTFAACAYYAPRGQYAMTVASTATGNTIHGSLGLVTYGTNYAGIYLAGPSNIIDICNIGAGCVNGVIDFTNDSGSNSVRVRGYQASGPSWIGTPHVSSTVDILLVGGATGGQLVQDANEVWTVYTPTPTASNGGTLSASATGKYKKIGKTCFWAASISVSSVGTGTGAINITNPLTGRTGTPLSTVTGRESAVVGKGIHGSTSANNTSLLFYDNTSPLVAGYVINVGGFYELA